jgi:hypothetical protein
MGQECICPNLCQRTGSGRKRVMIKKGFKFPPKIAGNSTFNFGRCCRVIRPTSRYEMATEAERTLFRQS